MHLAGCLTRRTVPPRWATLTPTIDMLIIKVKDSTTGWLWLVVTVIRRIWIIHSITTVMVILSLSLVGVTPYILSLSLVTVVGVTPYILSLSLVTIVGVTPYILSLSLVTIVGVTSSPLDTIRMTPTTSTATTTSTAPLSIIIGCISYIKWPIAMIVWSWWVVTAEHCVLLVAQIVTIMLPATS